MKKSLLVLFLALASFASAGPTQYENKTRTMPNGLRGTITDSAPTYALNTVSATVASSFIDLSATGALLVCVTASAGTMALIGVQYSNTNTAAAFSTPTAAVNSDQQLGLGCWPIQAVARWVRFVNQSTSQTAGVVNKVSVNYYVSNVQAVPVTASIGNAITVAQTTFASWTLLSSTTRTISAPIVLNLTTVAGTTGIMKYQIGSSNSNSSGFYWGPRPDATWIAPRNYYATSTTAFIDDYLTAGTHLNLSPASATDISNTAEINIWKLTQVVP